MNEDMCKFFEVIWNDFPDTLDDDRNYKFNNDQICETYCDKTCDNNCKTDDDKIMAGWISLLKTFYESGLINDYAPNNMNIGEYIIIWLIYMLKLKDDNTIIKLSEKYNEYIDNRGGYSLFSTDQDYSDMIVKLIVNKNYLVDMDKNIISNFYEAFKILCSMYNDINSDPSDCSKYFTKAKEFSDKYQNLLNNNNINNGDSSYSQILSTLSTDYKNFKSYCAENCGGCREIPSNLDAITTQISVEIPVVISEAISSSSSISSKLIPALLVFVIPVFLGVSYK
ncbi:Plasmodium variant antigen protein Cir/Yir/Bir, putative, partial [Plasmodium chabaudi adami]